MPGRRRQNGVKQSREMTKKNPRRGGERASADANASSIIRTLEKVTASGNRPSSVFEDWAELVEANLVALPGHIRAAAASQTYEDTPETQKLYERMRGRYQRRYFDLFAEAMGQLFVAAESDYVDTIGEVYMEFGLPNKRTGQFFTPMPVARMMALMVCNPQEINSRLKEAIRKSPLATALLLAGMVLPEDRPEICEAYFLARVVPAALEHYEPTNFCEPCCGSGVMFLAYAACHPWWMTQLGLVRLYGMDIDALCVRMARINIMMYGLNGRYAPFVVAQMEAKLTRYFRGDDQPAAEPAPAQSDEITPDLPGETAAPAPAESGVTTPPLPAPDATTAYAQLSLFPDQAITRGSSKKRRLREDGPGYSIFTPGVLVIWFVMPRSCRVR